MITTARDLFAARLAQPTPATSLAQLTHAASLVDATIDPIIVVPSTPHQPPMPLSGTQSTVCSSPDDSVVESSQITTTTCFGCLCDAPGQDAHMGYGGCLEILSQPFYESTPPATQLSVPRSPSACSGARGLAGVREPRSKELCRFA